MADIDRIENGRKPFCKLPNSNSIFKASGVSVVEILLAIVMFMTLFLGALRIYTESNLPQQAMIRDFAIAMNICERFINSLQNDFMEGDPPPVSDTEKDVTEAVLDNPAIQNYLKVFAGGVGKKETELVANFKTFLTVKKEDTDLYRLIVRFQWGARVKHTFTLQELVYKR